MAKAILHLCTTCNQKKFFRADVQKCPDCTKKGKEATVSTITKDTWEISVPNSSTGKLEEIIRTYNIDTTVWELDRFITSDKTKGDNPEFQLKALFKRRQDISAVKQELEELKKRAMKRAARPKKIKRATPKSSKLMLEINIIDHHFGKLAWGLETGGPSYDLKIARDVWYRSFDAILSRTKKHNFSEVLFVVGNDLMHVDNENNTTTSGTAVEADGRFQKTFSVVRNVIIDCIERLREVAPMVRVCMVRGNHDYEAVWNLGDSLQCYFANYTDVVIDNDPTAYKYLQFGKVMLMLCHGDKGKRSEWPMMMATQQPKMFGKTKFREVHTGHKHMTNTTEIRGVIVRTLPSLTPADSWHMRNGFVGNVRRTEAFIWDKEQGLISTVVYTDDDALIPKANPNEQKIYKKVKDEKKAA